MAHTNINERRYFVANILSRGVEIDHSAKKAVASKFGCHVSAIYADCNHFSKNGWHWELNSGNNYDIEKDIKYFTEDIRIYSPEEFQNRIIQIQFDYRLIQYFNKHPNKIYDLTPRQFEEFTAELLNQFGCKVTLSPVGPDEGIDIFAERNSDVGDELLLVQCKRFNQKKSWSANHSTIKFKHLRQKRFKWSSCHNIVILKTSH